MGRAAVLCCASRPAEVTTEKFLRISPPAPGAGWRRASAAMRLVTLAACADAFHVRIFISSPRCLDHFPNRRAALTLRQSLNPVDTIVSMPLEWRTRTDIVEIYVE